MINSVHNLYFKLKKRNYGLGVKNIKRTLQLFGLPASSWGSNIPFFFTAKKKNLSFKQSLLNSEKFLSNLVLSFPTSFNLGLYKKKLRRLRLLKSNRSLRGVRHIQCMGRRQLQMDLGIE